MGLSSVEMCAGAGGQALGLEQAGFEHEALIELGTTIAGRPHHILLPLELAQLINRCNGGVKVT